MYNKLNTYAKKIPCHRYLFPITHPGGEVNFRKRGTKFSQSLSHRHQNPPCTLEGSEVYKRRCTFSFWHPPSPFPFSTHTHTHACAKPLIHPWVEVKFTEWGIYVIIPCMIRGGWFWSRGKFVKKRWCCVGGRYNKIIWFYSLNWKCELATVQNF